MDRAWANDDEQALLRIGAIDNSGSLLTASKDGFLRVLGLRDLMLEKVGRGQGVVAADWTQVRIMAI